MRKTTDHDALFNAKLALLRAAGSEIPAHIDVVRNISKAMSNLSQAIADKGAVVAEPFMAMDPHDKQQAVMVVPKWLAADENKDAAAKLATLMGIGVGWVMCLGQFIGHPQPDGTTRECEGPDDVNLSEEGCLAIASIVNVCMIEALRQTAQMRDQSREPNDAA